MQAMYNLFLDDERFPLDVLNFLQDDSYRKLDWRIVRTASQFKSLVQELGVPECVSFDNDIQDFTGENQEEITGYKLAQWLVYYCIDNNICFPKIVKAHSRNVVDRPNIIAIFQNALKQFPQLLYGN